MSELGSTVDPSDLEKLHLAVEWLLQQEPFLQAVERLRGEIGKSREPFVWSTIALNTIDVALPATIQSCWVFHLKRDVPSGCHYHPNSVQHMIVLSGRGLSKVGGVERTMTSHLRAGLLHQGQKSLYRQVGITNDLAKQSRLGGFVIGEQPVDRAAARLPATV